VIPDFVGRHIRGAVARLHENPVEPAEVAWTIAIRGPWKAGPLG
jgi:hypothetical protein